MSRERTGVPAEYGVPSNRALNLMLAVALLAWLGPLLLFVALAIRLESTGPLLERRRLINREGRQFQELNFRVMECDETAAWPRNITWVGRFLLHTRVASLPQIFNVLRGDITLAEMHDNFSRY